ncbi:MAG TPA: hypothetical protein VGE13_02370 [Candidatus Saccharimonadales bacterium]
MAKHTKSKKSAQNKKVTSSKQLTKEQKKVSVKNRLIQQARVFLMRRPHRSFQRTRRRDYARSLRLPGYVAFTGQVFGHLWMYKRVFGGLILIYAIVSAILVGLASQSDFTELTKLLDDAGTELFQGAWGEIGKAGLLLASGISGDFSPSFSQVQQIFVSLLFLMIWLATVWLIRAHMAGSVPRLRDALYNSSAPLVSTVVIGLLLLLQAIPAIIAVVLYTAAQSTDLLSAGGAIAMVVGISAFLLIVLSLYFMTSGFFALIVVTLPGMYPWQAIRTAGDLVVGRRLRILLRLTWAVMVVVLIWVIVMIPIVLLSAWLQSSVQQLASIPIVPVALVVASSASAVFISAYVYMLYRKVVDDDAAPA